MGLPKIETKLVGVYCIQHRSSGKRYIGSTGRSIRKRWVNHFWRLRRGIHENSYLQRAWNEYGAEAFDWSVLEFCSGKSCLVREDYYIAMHRSTERQYGYNLKKKATGGNDCYSEESKEKMRIAKLGKRKSVEHCANMAAAMRGKSLSDEIRRKVSESQKERWRQLKKTRTSDESFVSSETRAKIARGVKAYWEQKGPRPLISEEQKKKIASSLCGRSPSQETREKISAALKGRTVSETTRAKMSACKKGNTYMLGCKRSAETREKISKSNTNNPKLKQPRGPLSEETKAKIAAAHRGKPKPRRKAE